MSNFKVGDRVIVGGKYKGTVKIEPSAYRGGLMGIETDERVYKHDLNGKCKANHGYWDYPVAVTLIKPTAHPTIIIHTDGITTTALLKEGKTVKQQAHAVCAPTDTFDFEYGARLALDRLFGHEVKAVPPSTEDEDKAICEQLMVMAKDRGLSSLSISASPKCSTCPGYCSVMEHRTGKGVTCSKMYHPEETK